jgi:hypothetical protein
LFSTRVVRSFGKKKKPNVELLNENNFCREPLQNRRRHRRVPADIMIVLHRTRVESRASPPAKRIITKFIASFVNVQKVSFGTVLLSECIRPRPEENYGETRRIFFHCAPTKRTFPSTRNRSDSETRGAKIRIADTVSDAKRFSCERFTIYIYVYRRLDVHFE